MTPKTVEPVLTARVQGLVDEVLAGTPHFVVDLEVRGARGARAVNVYLESDGALTIEELARIHRDLGFLLDTEGAVEGGYTLNVSSPGVDNPLKLPRQYKKNIGRVLRVHFSKAEGDGFTEVAGALAAADDEAIEVEVSGAQHRRIPYHDIVWAKVQLPW